MPHDRKGQKLAVGDRVRIPVRKANTYAVEPNPDYPDEIPGQFEVLDEAPMELEGTIVQLYEGEEACNAEFEVDGGRWTSTFNTRLVEKVEI